MDMEAYIEVGLILAFLIIMIILVATS